MLLFVLHCQRAGGACLGCLAGIHMVAPAIHSTCRRIAEGRLQLLRFREAGATIHTGVPAIAAAPCGVAWPAQPAGPQQTCKSRVTKQHII
jgi:hypothetical protein